MNDTLEFVYSRHNRNIPSLGCPPGVVFIYELTILIKGSLTYYLDGKEFSLGSGDAVYVPLGIHRYRPDCSENVDFISFNFLTPNPPALPSVLHRVLTKEVHLLIALHDEIYNNSHIDKQAKLASVLNCLLLSIETTQKATQLHPLARKILDYLHSNYQSKITLATIGAVTSFSPVHCDSIFRKETGQSIIDYLIGLRIEEAKQLLIQETVPIGRIAELTGFQDANYFSRAFKKRVGDTPSKYRQRVYGRLP